MTVRWAMVYTTPVLAGMGDAALLAINDPDIFVGSASAWPVALKAALGYIALVLAIVYVRPRFPLGRIGAGHRHRRRGGGRIQSKAPRRAAAGRLGGRVTLLRLPGRPGLHWSWLILSPFLTTLFLIACGGSADNPQDVLQDLNARDLVLTIEDLPEGIEVSITSELPITSNRAAFERFAADPVKRNEDLVGWGRTLGFRRGFDNAGQSDRTFDLFIASEAVLYRSEDGAGQAFAAERQDLVSVSRLTQVADLPSLGDESATFRLSLDARTEGEVLTDGYLLIWRRGSVLAFLRISITGGEIDRSLLVDLGQAADGLIANQLA